MKTLYTLAVILLFCSSLSGQTITTISELKNNNADGVPVYKDSVRTVTAIVTSSTQYGTSGPGSIQDSTGAISVYGSAFTGKVKIGDSVTVTSTVVEFRGLTQFDFNKSGTVTVHKSDCRFDTLTVTLKQIIDQEWNGNEVYESQLLRVNNVLIKSSGNFVSATNYQISDSTGTLEIRIDDKVSSLIGTPIPTGPVDLIGILGQYKSSIPYNTGYQIMPRFSSDIILTDNRPIILNNIYVSGVDTASFTVNFTTINEGSSKVLYGLTAELELDSVVINDTAKIHSVKVTGLESATKYYYKAISSNYFGTSESELKFVTTLSTDTVSTGQINVYFNFPVDTIVAIAGNNALGSINFPAKLIERINSASYSIDMAVYSFSDMDQIASAIITAKGRGVKVRVVYDDRTMQNSMQSLVNSGIQISKRPAMDGIMHNKFFIFDGRDENLTNDWVWTGSWNITELELNWKNNVVEINDAQLATAYTTEFEEMWGSSTDEPNSSLAKFGPYKTNNTVHSFTIGGRKVELYFSPSDQTESKIMAAMSSSDSSIYFANLTFTSNGIFDNIKNAFEAGAKDLRGIIDNINDNGSEFQNLKALAPTEVFAYNLSATLHHKYGIIDAAYSTSDPIVITGSHNWSNAANTKNDENTLIIHDYKIANKYMQEFKKRYNELGGTTAFVMPYVSNIADDISIPENIILFQNYPNPFNPVTTISFYIPQDSEIELSVTDILGRHISTIYSGYAKQGRNVFDFNAQGLTSGVYLYRLKCGSFMQSRKLIVLK